ncbi:MAG: hypothetical protein DRJ61_08565 [Acidobacteria bacterium]|nr:MAG: hypothetical protein DRJ61_08565 [Acidobacteriota bacterium]
MSFRCGDRSSGEKLTNRGGRNYSLGLRLSPFVLRMTRRILMRRFGKTLIMVAVMVSMVSFVAAQGGPKLVVEEKVIDLGEVPQGVVKDVKFDLRNEGSGPLTVKSVRPTCGCTVAEYDKEIPAGGTGSVRAKLDTTGFKGAISKSVLVMTDDLSAPIVTLAIKAIVKPYIDVMPRALVRFNALQKEKAEQKVVVVGTERSGAFTVTGVESESDAFEVSYRALGDGEKIEGRSDTQYEVVIRLLEDAPVGPISSVVKVMTTAPEAKVVEIKVFGVLRALLRVTPPELQFGAVEAVQAPGRNLIIVNNRPGTSVEITEAVVDDPAFTTEIVPIDQGKRYQVTVSIKRDASIGVKDAVLVLKTTDPDTPELRVPVRASLR